MCNNWKKKPENELTAHELDELLNSKWLKKLEIVSLTGGEPFLREDLEEIIDVFKKHKVPQIGITTNASLPEKICDVLNKTAGVSNSRFWLHISLDGRPEVHNRIRGVSTAYENVVKTILSVKSLGLENLTIAVGMCISNLNWNEINFVKNFAKNFGVRLVAGLAESGWIFGQEGTGKNLYKFTEQEKEAIIREMEEIGTWYSKGVIMRLNGVSKPIQCTAFWHGFTIAPNGDVHPCVNSNFVVGNIKETRFDEIWTCKQANHARRIVKKCLGCWSNCEMNYSYRNSFQKILWKASKQVKFIE
jgi:MoaA/NifB/PqqE/SkfB family radical SAM enzyme